MSLEKVAERDEIPWRPQQIQISATLSPSKTRLKIFLYEFCHKSLIRALQLTKILTKLSVI